MEDFRLPVLVEEVRLTIRGPSHQAACVLQRTT